MPHEASARKAQNSFAGEGAAVAIWDVNVERGEATTQQIRTSGGNALFCECDVTDATQIAHAVNQVTSELGNPMCFLTTPVLLSSVN